MFLKRLLNKIFKTETDDKEKITDKTEDHDLEKIFKVDIPLANNNEYETNDNNFENSVYNEFDVKITFKNINADEIKTKRKSKFMYNGKELFVEEVALEYYKNEGYDGLITENNYWWFIYALLFWDIIFMKINNNPGTEQFIELNGIPDDFFKETFYENRENEINKRITELRNKDLSKEIKDSYNKHYGKRCRPIEDWNKYTLNELLLSVENSENYQIISIMERLIKDFSQNRKGLPDLTLFKDYQISFVEVKSKKDTLSESQIKWHEYLINNSKIPVEIFTVNKTQRQINNLHKKYAQNIIEEKDFDEEFRNLQRHDTYVSDGLKEVKYRKMNDDKIMKATKKYFDVVIDYENKAKNLEKSNPDKAIEIYEKLVNEYRFGGSFPYERLLVLYRKEKKYEDMIRICDMEVINSNYTAYLFDNKIMFEKLQTRYTKKDNKFKETKRKTEKLLKEQPLKDKIKTAQTLEKQKEIDKAIKLYEEVIQEKYSKKLPYNRLCILYRKKKDYNKELETCNRAINILNDKQAEWFKDRKMKVETKINKK